MELWTVVTGLGALLAAGVSIWAVIVAHSANRIAKRALPLLLPAFEIQVLSHERYRFTNVGTAPLYSALAIALTDEFVLGHSGEPVTVEPGDSLELQVHAPANRRRVEIQGYEIREGKRIPRTIPLF